MALVVRQLLQLVARNRNSRRRLYVASKVGLTPFKTMLVPVIRLCATVLVSAQTKLLFGVSDLRTV